MVIRNRGLYIIYGLKIYPLHPKNPNPSFKNRASTGIFSGRTSELLKASGPGLVK